MVDNYQQALRIPRQHYKHLEGLKYEAIMEQRDAIIKKMKKKGIDLTKKGALVQMPDPSLPPAMQLEMLEKGTVVGGNTAEMGVYVNEDDKPKAWPSGM